MSLLLAAFDQRPSRGCSSKVASSRSICALWRAARTCSRVSGSPSGTDRPPVGSGGTRPESVDLCAGSGRSVTLRKLASCLSRDAILRSCSLSSHRSISADRSPAASLATSARREARCLADTINTSDVRPAAPAIRATVPRRTSTDPNVEPTSRPCWAHARQQTKARRSLRSRTTPIPKSRDQQQGLSKKRSTKSTRRQSSQAR
jgi:hypothetical protein